MYPPPTNLPTRQTYLFFLSIHPNGDGSVNLVRTLSRGALSSPPHDIKFCIALCQGAAFYLPPSTSYLGSNFGNHHSQQCSPALPNRFVTIPLSRGFVRRLDAITANASTISGSAPFDLASKNSGFLPSPPCFSQTFCRELFEQHYVVTPTTLGLIDFDLDRTSSSAFLGFASVATAFNGKLRPAFFFVREFPCLAYRMIFCVPLFEQQFSR